MQTLGRGQTTAISDSGSGLRTFGEDLQLGRSVFRDRALIFYFYFF